LDVMIQTPNAVFPSAHSARRRFAMGNSLPCVEERYEYRKIRIERAAWRKVAEAVHGDCADAVEQAGGSLFGLWRGEIGFHNDDGIVMTAWPAHTEPDHTT